MMLVPAALAGVRPTRPSTIWAAQAGLSSRPMTPISRHTAPKAFFTPPPVEHTGTDDCTVLREDQCQWSFVHGSCSPAGPCFNTNCGLFTCSCRLTPSSTRPPWRLLNVSSAACPKSVEDAYLANALVLEPDNNPGCRERARRELHAVRRAHDQMLGLVSINLAMGGTCDPAGDTPPTAEDPWSQLDNLGGGQQPVLLKAWHSARRWVRNSMRTLGQKVKEQVLKLRTPLFIVLGAVAIQVLAMMGAV